MSEARPRLSVCCMTSDPPARVAAALARLRGVADEVVVAVDDRLDPGALGPLAAVADRILAFPYRPPVNRARPWLAAQCRGRWLLLVDGDEVPSPSLVARIPDLLDDDEVLQHRIARRWLWPDAGHWLAEVPWWPDFQPRLVRNEPSVLRFGARPHQSLLGAHPADHVLEPLYHLDCLVNSLRVRRRKAEGYEAAEPGRVAYGGGPLSSTFYEPERTATLRPHVVPDEDRTWVERVLAATGPCSAVGAVAPAAVEPAEVDGHAPPGELAAAWCRAELAVVEADLRLAPGEVRPVLVSVRNAGPVTWPDAADPEPRLRLSYHLLGEKGGVVEADGLRTALPRRLRPGGRAVVPVAVRAPARPGRYLLRVDLVDEGVRWFGCEAEARIVVAERWGRFAFDPDGTWSARRPCDG